MSRYIVEKARVGGVQIGPGKPLALFAGPCVIEGRAFTLELASELRDLAVQLGAPLIFKASYDKANRTAGGSFRGLGLRKGLEILARVKELTGLPVMTALIFSGPPRVV